MDWSFLDKVDKNLLYLYARDLLRDSRTPIFLQLYTYTTQEVADEERCDLMNAEARRKNAYYIIWFVFRYVLGCDTLEKALQCATQETMDTYMLTSLLHKRHIYIGVYGINEVYLYKHKEGENDLHIVLDILYHRYDFFEQLECFIQRTEGSSRTTRNRCMKTLKETRALLEEHPEYIARFQRKSERSESV